MSIIVIPPSKLGTSSPYVNQHASNSEEEIALATLSVLESSYPASVDSGAEPRQESKTDLRPLPAHLSERSRRPSTLIRKDSDFSITKDAFLLEDVNTNICNVSGALPSRPSFDIQNSDASHSRATSTTAKLLSPQQKRKSLIQFIALCWCVWLIGWNDGSTGPLLPRIQEYYHVGFTVVSMIFIGNCFGYVIGAALNVWLNDRIGFGKVMVFGAFCQLCAYVIMAIAPPFPIMICAYFILGFGLSLQNAQANGFVGSLQENMSTKLGTMHAAYGLGAFTSPFAATYFSGLNSRRWAFHFIISVGLALSNLVLIVCVFRFKQQDDVLAEAGQEAIYDSNATQGGSKYRQILGLRAVHLLAVFAIIYVGIEVTLGGWIVTFIIHERDGGHSAGYISSGFFAGGIAVAGSAALPFITGLLASKYGMGSLQPLVISMMGVMVVVWGLVPKGTRRID